MDIIALSKANKAKKKMKSLQDRLGMNGTESGQDVKDIHANVKARLEALEAKDPHVTLYNRVSDVEAHTVANLNKHNLRMNAVVNKSRYGMNELAFDDFGDDTGIDASKSTGHLFDSAGRKVKINTGATQAEIVTTAETLAADPQMVVVAQSGLVKNTDSKPVDLVGGTLVNAEVVNGKIQLTSTDGGLTFSPSGSYESPVLDCGENFKSLKRVDQVVDVPVGTNLSLSTATSPDGITFSDYQPVNADGTLASPSARYIKVKAELVGGGETKEKLVYDFLTSERSLFEADEQVIFDGVGRLQTSYSYNMEADTSFTERGTLLRKTLDKNSFKSIEKIEVK